VTAGAFFDSNVPLYLLADDTDKAGKAEALLAKGGTISVQVLNEFVAVSRRKHAKPWPAIDAALAALRHVCHVESLTLATHERAVSLAKRYGFPICDATIAASALEAGCRTLYSEDFQHGQVLDCMTIRNPFL
jgi:predicted nucleic acid-binding protein